MTSIQSERVSIDESTKKVEVIVPTPLTQLLATNYRHWAMRMEVHLDTQGLWEAVTRTDTDRQKDCLALFIINFDWLSLSQSKVSTLLGSIGALYDGC